MTKSQNDSLINNKQLSDLNEEYIQNDILSCNLENDIQKLKNIFEKSFDIVFREFEIGSIGKGALIFVNGFVNIDLIDSNVLKPLLNYDKNLSEAPQIYLEKIKKLLENQVIEVAEISWGEKITEVVDHILSGDTILLIDKVQEALFISLREWSKRSITEPVAEQVIRGPREGFTENLLTNTILIRRRLKTPKLIMEKMCIGKLSKTDIVLTYLESIADESVVSEIRQRINKINIDGILESEYIEELIEDNPYSIFPQTGYTERPDKVAASLLEGQIAIIIDNTPIVLIVPQTFFQMMQVNEDHYERYIFGTVVRWMRFLFLGLALTLPSIYIALTTIHQEMIPTKLLLSMAASRQEVPFPTFIETLMMEIFFEGLREAGVRLPGQVGAAVTIVGALVIGQAAVQAKIVSAPIVIIVAATGISSFIIPSFNQAIAVRLLRFPLMFISSILGLYGILLYILFILIHLCKLRTYGVPYLSPVAPLNFSALKDVFIRAPRWALITRPKFTGNKNSKRIKHRLLFRFKRGK